MPQDTTAASQDARQLLDLTVTARVAHAPALLRAWYSEQALRAQLSDALAVEVERALDMDVKRRFHGLCALEGTTPDDFGNRLLTLTDGTLVLAGIRFRGGDLARPFVDVVMTTTALVTSGDVARVARELAAHFAVFAPEFVRVRLSAEHLPDLVTLAAPIAELHARPAPRGADLVELVPGRSLSFVETYEAQYARLHDEHPEHREFARPEDREDLAETLEAGGVFEVRVDGHLAGVVAARRDSMDGLRGFVVQELFLYGTYRGRGLGAALSHHLARALPGEDGDVLYGTIHAENTAALRAARRAGRQDVLAGVFVRVLNA